MVEMHAPRRLRVSVLGATGSIGTNTLDVISRHPERFEVFSLTGASRVPELLAQCQRWRPRYAVMPDGQAAARLREAVRECGLPTEVLDGEAALVDVAAHPDVDIVMGAIVGAAGLPPCLAAARAGKRLLLANKEALVVGGELFMQAVRDGGATLVPIDSEHSAIFQCLPQDPSTWPGRIDHIVLTASGGPFRQRDPSTFADITPEQACAHPNWVMGRKISVDSATMMNKALEVIEARWLFDLTPDQVRVVIHPQSIVHSLVEYVDGSVLAQLGNPDMRTPIAHALAWPERIESGVKSLNLFELARLDFESPDLNRFPCLRLAYAAARPRGPAPVILNAANEVAVQAFLDRRIGFTDIPRVIEHPLSLLPASQDPQLGAVLSDDVRARETASRFISSRASRVGQGA